MKSKLITLYNYTYLIPTSISEEIPVSEIWGDVEHECKNLRFQHKKMIHQSIVEKNDCVTLTLQSELKKYNRSSLQLTVGSNFFSKELESFLIGKEVGKEYEIMITDTPVSVLIKECLHTLIPELDDTLIQEANIENVTTVQQFQQYTLQKYKNLFHEYYTEYLAMNYLDEWIDKCTWEIDENELNDWWEAITKLQEEELAFHNATIYENYPGEIKEENLKMAKTYLKAALIDCFFKGQDPLTYPIDLSSMNEINALGSRVQEPLKNMIRPRFTIIWKEDN